MGLDQYAYIASKANQQDEFYEDAVYDETVKQYVNPNVTKPREIAYWRKHPNLHGWMEQLYRDRGGPKESFNCAPLRLYLEDLDQLQRDIGENKLEPTEGFFFGSQTIYPEDVASAMKFIFEARDAIKQGDAVYYDSWW